MVAFLTLGGVTQVEFSGTRLLLISGQTSVAESEINGGLFVAHAAEGFVGVVVHGAGD